MNCQTVSQLLDDYLDGALSTRDKQRFEAHLETCPACRQKVNLQRRIVEQLTGGDQITLPDSFTDQLHSKLVKAARGKQKKSPLVSLGDYIKRHRSFLSGALAASLVFSVAIGLLSTTNMPTMSAINGVDNLYSADEAAQEALPADASRMNDTATDFNEQSRAIEQSAADQFQTRAERVLLKNGVIVLEVTAYQETKQSISDYINQIGGYIENEETRQISDDSESKKRYLSEITLRLPSDYYLETEQTISQWGNVVYRQSSVQDVTQQYRDVSSEIDNLKARQAALREIMKDAKTIDDVLKVDNELSEVRIRIDKLTGQIKLWDQQEAFSTIELTLEQVEQADQIKTIDRSLAGRAYRGLVASFNALVSGLEWLIIALSTLLPFAAILLIITLAIRLFRRKK